MNRVTLPLAVLLLVACSDGATGKTPSSAEPSRSQSSSAGAAASAALIGVPVPPKGSSAPQPAPSARAGRARPPVVPPIRRSEPVAGSLGAIPVRAELCQLDVSMSHAEFFLALRGAAVDKDAALYLGDHEGKVRRFNPSVKGCDLKTDTAFGAAGVVDLGLPKNAGFEKISVDENGVVYVQSDPPMRIVSGSAQASCGALFSAPTVGRLVNEVPLPCEFPQTKFQEISFPLPYVLALEPEGVLLTDRFKQVTLVNWTGAQAFTVGGDGSADARVSLTKDAALRKDLVLVVDFNVSRLRAYQRDGAYVGAVDPGALAGAPSFKAQHIMTTPEAVYLAGVALGEDGKFYAAIARLDGL